jgi:DNA-binding CsgD family transcriptional regulator
MDSGLVERIYECSLVPDGWPGVLDELGMLIEGTGASLMIGSVGARLYAVSPGSQQRSDRFPVGAWFHRGQVINRLFAARHAGFITDLDMFTLEEWEAEPLYIEMWRPTGVGWVAGTAIPLPTGDNLVFCLTRTPERGPVEKAFIQRLDALRPHLARSAFMSARLQMERARVAGETLAALGLPALVLDDRGKVLAANSLIDALTPYVRWRAFDRVSLLDKFASQLLRDALEAIMAPDGPVRSFPVRDGDSGAMMVAHLVPICLSARDIFVRCAAALIFTPVTLPEAPPVELVQSLFDLTPAEARVARSLAAGETVQSIASAQNVSESTVRTHVRGVLQKTGCNRQVEIVSLLAAISPARLTTPGNR